MHNIFRDPRDTNGVSHYNVSLLLSFLYLLILAAWLFT